MLNFKTKLLQNFIFVAYILRCKTISIQEISLGGALILLQTNSTKVKEQIKGL